MRIRDYQRTWQGLSIDALPTAATSTPVASPFYEQFYDEAQRRGEENWKGRAKWVEQKRKLGALLADLLEECGVARSRSHRVLSLGAGYGIAEEVLVDGGFSVDLQDCQAVSLRPFHRKHHESGAFVCDARSVSAIDSKYAAVCLIALEYAFDTEAYATVLREVSRLLVPGGIAMLVSASNVQLRDLLLGWPRRLKDRLLHNGKPAVYWGYRRTLDAHIRIAAASGLRVNTVIGLDSASLVQWRREDDISPYWPFFTDAAQAVIVFRKSP